VHVDVCTDDVDTTKTAMVAAAKGQIVDLTIRAFVPEEVEGWGVDQGEVMHGKIISFDKAD
jgi:hypothetical protein